MPSRSINTNSTTIEHSRNKPPAIVSNVRIGIDIRKLNDFGVGTYVRNLIRQLGRIDQDTEYVLLCQNDDCNITNELGENFRAVPDSAKQYSLQEQLSVPFKIFRASPNLFHTPHYILPILTPCRSIVTIHDCIHLLFPQYLRNRLEHTYAYTMFWTAVHKANRILTVSETSKRDILKLFDLPEEKVTVIYNAIDERFYREPSEENLIRVRERHQLHDRFLMYSGNVKPHKNLELLINAFSLLRKDGLDDLKLLITGSEISKYAPLRRAVHRHNIHQHVRFLGYQSEETLAILYRLADVFVFPSLYEGFGLPPLEAMASGTPVVVSNVSSLPEVVGNAGILVDPYDARAIADGISQVICDDTLRQELKVRGVIRARSFSWKASVAQIHKIYKEVAEDN